MKRKGPAWISGASELHHKMYVAYGYQRQMARRRQEPWLLTWPQWRDMWLPVWDQRGVTKDALCLVRSDIVGEWHRDNVEIITRREHGQRIRRYYS